MTIKLRQIHEKVQVRVVGVICFWYLEAYLKLFESLLFFIRSESCQV